MKNKILSIILIASLIAGIGSVAAVNYVLQMSSPVGVNSTPGTVQVPVSLSPNGTSVSDLDSLVLTASVANINGVGKTVTFYDNGSSIGTAVIANVGGVFQAKWTVASVAAGFHSYTAGP